MTVSIDQGLGLIKNQLILNNFFFFWIFSYKFKDICAFKSLIAQCSISGS